jgi:hypothetical protein
MCLTQTGCSFTFVETVPDHPEKLRYFDCTSTPGLPVADGVFALTNAVGGVASLTQSKKEYADKNDGANRDVVAGVSIAVAVIGIASGIYGLITTDRCRDAKSELRSRLIPPAEREQKKLDPSVAPTPSPAWHTPAGVAPGSPTSVEPVAPSTAPALGAPSGMPQQPSVAPGPSTAEAAPETAPPTAAPPAAGAPAPAPVQTPSATQPSKPQSQPSGAPAVKPTVAPPTGKPAPAPPN